MLKELRSSRFKVPAAALVAAALLVDGRSTLAQSKPPNPALPVAEKQAVLRRQIDNWYEEAQSEQRREFLHLYDDCLKGGLNSKSPYQTAKNAPASPQAAPVPVAVLSLEDMAEDSKSTGDAPNNVPEQKIAAAQEPQAKKSPEIITDVRIVGNGVHTTEEIMRRIRIRSGMEFSRSIVLEEADRLNLSRKFKDVNVRVRRLNNGVQVTFEICEFPNLVQEVVFRHARQISQKDLDDITRDIQKGLPMNPALNKAAIHEIQQFLKKVKGCYWADVVLEEGGSPSDHRVIFDIIEGPVVRVRSVKFVGAEGLPGIDQLDNLIKVGSVFEEIGDAADARPPASSDETNGKEATGDRSFRLGGLASANGDMSAEIEKLLRRLPEDWNRSSFNAPAPAKELSVLLAEYKASLNDRDRVVNQLQAKGYVDAKVQREAIFSEDCSQVDVVFHIDAGPRSKLDRIMITENPLFSETELTNVIQQKPGDWYDEERVIQDMKSLVAYIWLCHGIHGQMVISARVSGPGLVTVSYDIKELSAPRIGQVFYAGAEPTMEQMWQGPPCILWLLDLESTSQSRFLELPSMCDVKDFVWDQVLSPLLDLDPFGEPTVDDQPKEPERRARVDAWPESVADPLKTLSESKDTARRAAALAALKEPLQSGGTQKQQDRYVEILVQAAGSLHWNRRFPQIDDLTKDDSPLMRLGAIQALAGYKDPRAAEVLAEICTMPLPFFSDVNSRIRCHALAALEKTGSPLGRETYLRVCSHRCGNDASPDRQISRDERLAAVRGLARFNDQEVLKMLIEILAPDRDDVALIHRAHMSLQAITGQDLPPNAAAWRKFIETLR